MMDPILVLSIAGVLTLIACLLFWPGNGLFWRWQRIFWKSERAEIEDAAKHVYDQMKTSTASSACS